MIESCYKCQQWEEKIWDNEYREPAKHFDVSFEAIGTMGIVALRLDCPDCKNSFNHSFDWGERDIDEGVIVIVGEEEET